MLWEFKPIVKTRMGQGGWTPGPTSHLSTVHMVCPRVRWLAYLKTINKNWKRFTHASTRGIINNKHSAVHTDDAWVFAVVHRGRWWWRRAGTPVLRHRARQSDPEAGLKKKMEQNTHELNGWHVSTKTRGIVLQMRHHCLKSLQLTLHCQYEASYLPDKSVTLSQTQWWCLSLVLKKVSVSDCTSVTLHSGSVELPFNLLHEVMLVICCLLAALLHCLSCTSTNGNIIPARPG